MITPGDWIRSWPAWGQAAGLALLTLVTEDGTTVGAGLLRAAGRLPGAVAFWGCALGIWLGDAGLYALARWGGRPWLKRPWVARRFPASSVERGERWFAERGTWALVASRWVPGARLPTYLAAGLLRVPLNRFLVWTGGAALAWTLVVFTLASLLGSALVAAVEGWRWAGWLVGLVLAALLAGWLVRRGASEPAVFRAPLRWRLRAAVDRWRHWEFWPAWAFYPPVVAQYLRLAWRHRGLTVPTAANPGLPGGGFVGESKFATLRDLQATCPEFTAETWWLEAGPAERRIAVLEALCSAEKLAFPFILKPDVGQRGVGVKRVDSAAEAVEYLRQVDVALVVQRYVPGPGELGVFYVRHPGEARGRIFAVTEKIFPVLRGDGRRSWRELIWSDGRARCVAGRYLERLGAVADEVGAHGAELRLVEAGNHAQGCIFRDGFRLVTPELEDAIERISRSLPGFFIGRYDLRYADESELRAGRSFRILELNGATAEATSIYDARNSLGSAYRTLFRQWELVFAIGAANRAAGCAPMSVRELLAEWRRSVRLTAHLPVAD